MLQVKPPRKELILAKTGVLFASVFAGIAGFVWLKRSLRQASAHEAESVPQT